MPVRRWIEIPAVATADGKPRAGVRPVVRDTGGRPALPSGPVEVIAADGITDADPAGPTGVPVHSVTTAIRQDTFTHVAQVDEFGSTRLRDIAAEVRRRLDGDIVRLGAAS